MIDKILCSSPPSHRSYGRRSSLHGGGGAGRGHYQPGERNIWYICAQRQNLATWTCYSQPPILGQRFSKKLLEFSAKFKLTTQKAPKLHYISMNLNFHWYFYEFPWLTHFVVIFFARFLYFFRQLVWPEKWTPPIFPLLDQFADLSVQTQFGFWLIFLLNWIILRWWIWWLKAAWKS